MKAKAGAEARDALWSDATQAKFNAGIKAIIKAGFQKDAEVEKAQKKQGEATHAKANADTGSMKATETKKAAPKVEQASKRANKAAKKAKTSESNEKSGMLGLVFQCLLFFIAYLLLLVLRLFG